MSSTTTPVPSKPYFILTEEAENQLWRSRELLKTLSDLAEAAANAKAKATLTLSAENLSVTLSIAAELLNLPMTYVTKHKENRHE